MKNKFIKLISSVLVLAFLLSSFVVFASANEEENTETVAPVDTSDLLVLVNRTFEEGWEFANGFSGTVGNNKFGIEYEETDDYNYNYYTRVEALTTEKTFPTSDKDMGRSINSCKIQIRSKLARALPSNSILLTSLFFHMDKSIE